MVIVLSKNETLKILYKAKRRSSKRYGFCTKHKWHCLHCLETIYVSYKQYGRNNIFCDNCRPKANAHTIVQYQYMRVLKEQQIQSIEKMLNNSIDK